MWWFSWVLWLSVCAKAIYGADCLAETLKCSRLRRPLETHKNLFSSPQEMKDMCRQQDQFFKCLDFMVVNRATGGASLPPPLKLARTLVKDLCLNTSSWQKKYFELAPCINMQSTEFCTSLEFLRTVRLGDKPRSVCSLREEAVNCIAVTLALNCGLDAGKLFRHLLRMTSDGGKDCYVVGSGILFPTIQGNGCNDDVEQCSEVFGNSVKRTGSIPNHDEPVEESRPVSLKDFSEDGDFITEGTTDEFSSTPISTESSMPFTTPYTIQRLEEQLSRISPEKFDTKLQDFKIESALRFHGKNSLSEYVRFPGLSSEEFSFCKNEFADGKKMYICTYVLRDTNPTCLIGGRDRNRTGVPIDPENIDPELGATLYAMFPYAYHFRPYEEMHERMLESIHEYNKNLFKHIHEFKSESHQTTTGESHSETRKLHDLYRSLAKKFMQDTPVARGFDSSTPENLDGGKVQEGDGNSEGVTSGGISEKPPSGGLLRDYAKMPRTPRLRRKAETMAEFTEPATQSSTASVKSNYETTNLSEEQDRLFTLLMKETEWLIEKAYKAPAKVHWITPTAVRIAVDGRENSQLVNVTCGRVNECHPNATDIERCLYYFALDDEVSEVDTEQYPVVYRISRDSVRNREFYIDSDDILKMVEEGSGIVGNAKPVNIFDKSHDQYLGLTESEMEDGNRDDLEESVEISEDQKRKDILFTVLEPSDWNRILLEDFEPSLRIQADDASVEDEDVSSEDVDIFSKDEDPASDSSVDIFKDNPQEILHLLQYLKNLEDVLTNSLDNIQID